MKTKFALFERRGFFIDKQILESILASLNTGVIMNRFVLFVLAGCLLLLACQKNNEPSFVPDSFPGSLDSCCAFIRPGGFSSDSGVYSGEEWQKYKFSYDGQRRVKKMVGLRLGINLSDIGWTFYYDGDNRNPYMVVDSSIGVFSSLPRITKRKLYYDSENRVILDSATTYVHQSYGVINVSSSYKKYIYALNYMTIFDSQYPTTSLLDTVFFNSIGDQSRKAAYFPTQFSGWDHDSFEYYSIESPFAQLNIRKVLPAITSMWWASLPKGSISFNQPRYLFKKVSGITYESSRPADRIFEEAYCYYEKDIADRVNRITMVTYMTKPGQNRMRQFYACMGFFYHQ